MPTQISKDTILNLMLLKKYEKDLAKQHITDFKNQARYVDHNTFKRQLFSIVKG